MRTIKDVLPDVTAEQAHLLTLAISTFGCGQHPFPDTYTLPGFATDYAARCLRKAAKNNLVPAPDRKACAALAAVLDKATATA